LIFVFFWQVLFKGLLPIPSDDIVGLYHPFRDLYAKDYPNGIPFKNFLITDPVRQQYPWKELVISVEKKMQLPLWNPYVLSGSPLLANFQSAGFYPLNILFFILPFPSAWSVMIFLGPMLAGLFLYLYLDNLKLSKWASVLGAFTFAFCGFFVAWMEWGTITQVALWLPLVLLSIDKLVLNKMRFKWAPVYLLSLLCAFFAGHLQTFFYLGIVSFVYFILRWWQHGKKPQVLIWYLMLNIVFLLFSLVQSIPALQFIGLSARNIDVGGINSEGWFIPYQHLIQFVVPDYFGNPATLNYWGTWNYGELVGYAGMVPLILGLYAMYFRRDKKTLFFGLLLFLSLFFSLPTFLAKLPFILKVPFLSEAQPTRLIFIADFALAVLGALGFDYLLKTKKKIYIICPLILLGILLLSLISFVPKEHILVLKSNLIFPALLLLVSSVLFVSLIVFQSKKRMTVLMLILLLAVTGFDLLRFGWKYNPFTPKTYLFPQTKTISFLTGNLGNYRFMTTDSRILPPNFSSVYRLQAIDGYDPLYLQRYGELIIAMERNKSDITPPFGFNRIITPHNYSSKIADLLGVRYILSLSELNSPNLRKVFEEGQTMVYENLNVIPRAFFVTKLKNAKNKEETIDLLFADSFDPNKMAVTENADDRLMTLGEVTTGQANIVSYAENKVVIETENKNLGFLVLTDTFYPTWKATIDGRETQIYRTDYDFRGIIVPGGSHKVEFYITLF
jgi:hypothetical protein